VTSQAPPLKWLLAYRLLGLRLPPEYNGWVAEDARSRFFTVWRGGRTFVWGLVLVGLYRFAQAETYQPPAFRTMKFCVLAVALYAILGSGPSLAKRALRWQRVDKQGNPVPPKGLARHGNLEAALVVALVALLWTGGSAVFGYGLRPAASPFADVPCGTPDQDTMSLINAGLTHPKATYMAVRTIPFGTGVMVGALLTEPNPKPGGLKSNVSYETWIIEAGQVYTYGHTKLTPSWTKFPEVPAADRIAPEARLRLASCVGSAVKK
jgi:hypothetical protein